jgi:hypothetical protein
LTGITGSLSNENLWKKGGNISMRTITLIVMTILIMTPGISVAQMHGGGQHMMGGQGMSQCAMGNMDMMNQMTGEMQQMMSQGQMTPGQHQQMMDMMNQMGQMKQQMGGSMTPQMEQQQQQKLQDMQQRWNTMKTQLQKPGQGQPGPPPQQGEHKH